MPDLNRRQIIAATLAIASGSLGVPGRLQSRTRDDEEQFWSDIALEYDLDDRYTVLNGGGNNPLPRRVASALRRYQEMAASQPRPFNYEFINYREEHRRRLARLLGCDSAEVALTRNTTEGLNIVARGLAFERGDRVLFSPFEEHYAYRAFEPLASRYGVELKVVDLPVAPSTEQVVSAFAAEMTPGSRLLVASHIVDSWGYVLPIDELAALAHRSGARLLVDGALSFGHIPVDVKQLGCDYFATSLHKWLNAPLGTGVLFVREDRIEDLWPLYGVRRNAIDIRKFEEIGTRDGAVIAAIGQAIDFYELIGPERKAERLRFLLSRLIERLSGVQGVQVITEPDAARRAGLARVVVDGWTGVDLTTALRERFAFYVYGNFPGDLDGVYVSPNVFNSLQDIERFAAAVKELAT